jgi:hypothetical protein
MESKNPAELSDEELIQEEKKQKQNLILYGVFVIFMMGVAIWSATHKGSVFLSFLPLFLMPMLGRLDKKHKDLKAEIQSRKFG